MNKFILLCLIIFILPFSSGVLASNYNPISLDEVMRLTEINSPRLSVAKYHEIAAMNSVDIARANYFPTVNAEAIDSTGFSGSSGLLGVGGVNGITLSFWTFRRIGGTTNHLGFWQNLL